MPPTSAAMELKVLISVLAQGTTLKSLTTDAQKLSAALKNLQQGQGSDPAKPLKDAGNAGERAASGVEKLNASMGKLTSTVKFLAGGFLALESIKFIKSLADVAARTEVLGTVLHVVALNAGYTADQIDKVDKKVQSLGITAQSSRQSLTQLLQARIKLEYAPQLARAAQDLAVISGQDSSVTFERLITSIQRLNTISLRTMGIVVDRAKAEENFKRKLGDTTKALNDQEKEEALTQEVLSKAIILQGTYESAMNNAGKQLTSLVRLNETYRETLGNALLPAYSAVIARVSTLFEKLTIAAQQFSENKERAQAFADAMDSLAKTFSDVAVFLANNLDTIVTLVKWYLELRGTILLLNLAANGLKWLTSFVDWATSAVRATTTLVTWLRTLGTTSVVEAPKIATVAGAEQAVAVAQTEVAASAGPAAAGIAATGVAAEGATVAVTGLAAAWSSIATLMAIPVVGLIIYKLSAGIIEDKNKPALQRGAEALRAKGTPEGATDAGIEANLQNAFSDWMRETHPEVALNFGNEPEWFKKFVEATTKFERSAGISKEAEELGKARAELTAAVTAQQQLLHPEPGVPKALSAEKIAAQERIDTAVEGLKKLQEAQEKALKDSIKNVTSQQLQAQVDKVQDLKTAFGKLPGSATRLEKDTAQAAIDVEKARLEVMKEINEEAMKTKGITDPERLADEKAQAQARKTLQDTADAAEQLRQAQQSIFGAKFDFTAEGIGSTAFGKAVGGYKDILAQARKALDEDGEVPRDMADSLRKGMIALGIAAKTPLDLENIKKQIAAVQDLEKAVPGIREAAAQAGKLARIEVDQARLAELAPLTAKEEKELKYRTELQVQEAKRQLDSVKTAGASESTLIESLYHNHIITLEEYYNRRKKVVRDNASAERDVMIAQLEQSVAEQRAAQGRGDTDKVKDLELQINTQKEALRTAFGTEENDLFRIIRDRIDKIKAARDAEIEATLTQQASIGGTREQLALLNFQLAKEIEKYHDLNSLAGEQLVTLEGRIKTEAILQKQREEAYQAELAIEKSLQDQLDLRQQGRSVVAAQDKAEVVKGTMTDLEAQRRSNARNEAEMEDNRIRRASKERELAEARLNALVEGMRLYVNLNNELEDSDTKQAEISRQLEKQQQGFQTGIVALQGDVANLDTAYANLGASIQSTNKQISDSFEGAFANALDQMVFSFNSMGKILADMAKTISQTIIGIFTKAFAEAFDKKFGISKFVSGLADKLLGLGGGGSGTGAGAASLGEAEGGLITGPGTGTSDSIPAMLSTGEHVMPASKTAQWLPLLEGIRLGRILPAYALGGVVSLQSIAMSPIIPRRYAAGGMVSVADAGASNVMPGGGGAGNMVISLHPDAMNLTLREWLEQEVVRQQGRR